MSQKMMCPGCGSYTSSILRAVEDGEACPTCGLSAAAIIEIEAIKNQRGNEKLKEQLEAALVRAGRAEEEARKLRAKLDRLRWALEEDPACD